MDITFLGTGGSFPTPDRGVSAIVVRHGTDQFLLDCGEGTQRQFMISDLSFMKTSLVLLTHFHGDHFLGLPGLLQSMSLNNREEPLLIAGPEGTKELVKSILELGHFNPCYEVNSRDLASGDVFKFGELEISCAKAEHNVPALAYKIESQERPGKFDKAKALSLGIPEGPSFGQLQKGETITIDGKTYEPRDVMGTPRKGFSVVFSGDTAPCDSIEDLARNATALIHEATGLSDLQEKLDEWGHSSAKGAAELAKRANVSELFLFHISARYTDTTAHLEEAEKIFPGVHIPLDLETFTLKTPK